jgi:iron complex outermembrane receptor protein
MNSKNPKVAMLLIAFLVANSAHSQASSTQDNTSATSDESIGEITVTAQRRTERLQDVPVAVSTIQPDLAQAIHVDSLRDLQIIVPTASFGDNYSISQLFIRGLGQTQTATSGLESPVSTYFDGGYLVRGVGIQDLLNLYDAASIQVLRGPQGTLYGRNATGGVILLSSANPTNKVEGDAAVEYGRFDHRKFQGMFNTPLTDTLDLRVAGRVSDGDNYVTDLVDGSRIGGGSSYSFRVKLDWHPNDVVNVLFGTQYDHDHKALDASIISNLATCLFCAAAGVTTQPGFYQTQNTPYPQFIIWGMSDNLRVDVKEDAFTFSSITTYRHDYFHSTTDQDGTPVNYFSFGVPNTGGHTVTQDFQITSNNSGPFSYVAGLSYLHDNGIFDIAFTGDLFNPPPPAPPSYLYSETVVVTNSVAGFFEGSYKFTPEWKLTLGGRYTHDDRKATGQENEDAQAIFDVPASYERSASFNAFTPRAVIAWDNGPTNIYYSFTRGFKAGGLGSPSLSIPDVIQPETISGQEIGWKQLFWDGRAQTSLTAFYHKDNNLQVSILDTNGGGQKVENAGAIQGKGVEFDSQLRPVNGVTLGATAGYLHSVFLNYPNATQSCLVGGVLSTCNANLAGFVTPHSPKFTGGLWTSVDFNVASWSANLAAALHYSSQFDFFANAGGPLQSDRQGGYALANLSGYVSPPNGHLRVGFYVDNVFNKEYATYRTTNQPYDQYYVPAMPITYGGRIEYRF